MKFKLFVLGALMAFALNSQAWTYTLSSSMYWDSLPFSSFSNFDEIEIPAGKTLIINGNCDDLEGVDLIINIYGTLSFGTSGSSADELRLSSSSMISLFNNGVVSAATCVGQKSIYFGGTRTATCTGGSTGGSTGLTYHTFSDINTSGGISASGPVPVTWLTYDALSTPFGTTVLWSTASEKNNSHFEIEMSLDGENWELVAFEATQAEGGNSDEILNYSFDHQHALQASHLYYRIKQTDFNGEFSYSEMMTVSVDLSAVSLVNQAGNTVKVDAPMFDNTAVILQVHGINGELVDLVEFRRSTVVQLPKPGIYIFEVVRNGRKDVLKHALL